MRKTPRVALLIETSRAYGRGLLQGVVRYLREHDSWSIYFQPHDLGAPVPCWLKTWDGDGILARIEDRRSAELIRRTGLPAVDLRFSVPDTGLPGVGIDTPGGTAGPRVPPTARPGCAAQGRLPPGPGRRPGWTAGGRPPSRASPWPRRACRSAPENV